MRCTCWSLVIKGTETSSIIISFWESFVPNNDPIETRDRLRVPQTISRDALVEAVLPVLLLASRCSPQVTLNIAGAYNFLSFLQPFHKLQRDQVYTATRSKLFAKLRSLFGYDKWKNFIYPKYKGENKVCVGLPSSKYLQMWEEFSLKKDPIFLFTLKKK